MTRRLVPNALPDSARDDYLKRRDALAVTYRQANSAVRLDKDTSNLFRNRSTHEGVRLNVRDFDHVIEVNNDEMWIDVEGMTPYVALTDVALVHGVMPTVVPQLKSITIGGAVSGIGIESTSFRFGLPHETILEMDVLTGDGQVVTCTPDNDNKDLFFGIPNSYGTLGYILRLRVKTIPVKPYVKLTHQAFASPEDYFAAMQTACDSDSDFLDGCVFDDNRMVLTQGVFVDHAPYVSDYTWMKMYFRSIQERHEDFLDIRDYIWRWDTDWFWCSKHVGAQNPVVRFLAGRKWLNSVTYQKIMRWNTRVGVTARINHWLGRHTESVIQDVDIPLSRACEFLTFFNDEIGIKPIWTCPVQRYNADHHFDLFSMSSAEPYVNFGFWDVVIDKEAKPRGFYNRKIEQMVASLGGVKSLYSDSYYSRDEFWQHYDKAAYGALKQRYDSDARLSDLYDKCVGSN